LSAKRVRFVLPSETVGPSSAASQSAAEGVSLGEEEEEEEEEERPRKIIRLVIRRDGGARAAE
jgi:hypothetical protein